VNEEDVKQLLEKYNFSNRVSFNEWLQSAQEVYRLLYKEQSDKHNFDVERVRKEGESIEDHTKRLAALNHVLEETDFQKVKAALDPLAIEYFTNEMRHRWTGCQEFGGTVQLGYLKRLDALEYLNKAVKEVNVIYIDDYHHFIFFRTPSIQPSK
jgi:enolase